MQMKVTPEWITYAQAQRLVGLGRTTLWRLVNTGEIKAAHVGRAVRLNRKSLEDCLERAAADDAYIKASPAGSK
jgi:excisionase family DNA binding protein